MANATFDLANIIPSHDFVDAGAVQQVDSRDQDLCDACRVGDLEKARKALEDGANASAQFRLALGEITPIFLCASKGYIEIAALLIGKDKGCINHRIDFDGTLCLHHAASNNQSKMCEFLINQGCNINQKDKMNRTPLMDAAEIGSEEVINIFIDHGADVNKEDLENCTALSYCMDFISNNEPKYFKCALLLVRRGCNPNYPGKYAKRTLLHCCAAKGDLDLVKELTEDYNASLKVGDSDGRFAINYAAEYEHKQVFDYLQQKMDEQNSGCCTIL